MVKKAYNELKIIRYRLEKEGVILSENAYNIIEDC